MTLSTFGALGEYERSVIIERIQSGIARAKMQGRKFGRPRVHGDEVRARVIKLRAGSQGVLALSPHQRDQHHRLPACCSGGLIRKGSD